LIAALFDLLQHQTSAAMSRLAYGAMILLAVAFGLSIIIGIVGVDLSPQPSFDIAYSQKLLLRAIASFIAGGAFAMLFNNSIRTVLLVGPLALVANETLCCCTILVCCLRQQRFLVRWRLDLWRCSLNTTSTFLA
jgi:uncharacterized membrane protein YjjB (DUF3815 family)